MIASKVVLPRYVSLMRIFALQILIENALTFPGIQFFSVCIKIRNQQWQNIAEVQPKIQPLTNSKVHSKVAKKIETL